VNARCKPVDVIGIEIAIRERTGDLDDEAETMKRRPNCAAMISKEEMTARI